MRGPGRFSPLIFPGAVFELLTVIKRIPGSRSEKRRAKVLCLCRCGKEVEVDCSNLTNGNSKSCGCEKYKGLVEANTGKRCTGEYGKVIPGSTFARLTVVERIWEDGRPTYKVDCLCKCGNRTVVGIDALLSGNSRSCGCWRREVTAKRNVELAKFKGFSKKHPMTFATWKSMRMRTFHPDYPGSESSSYGTRRIQACNFLWESPINLQTLIGDRPTKESTLDRHPVHNGNYTCGQCNECKEKGWNLNIRWASRKEQSLNRGNFNVKIAAFGKTLTKSQWADLTGMDADTIHGRIKRGWDAERSLTTPDKFGNRYKVTET